MQCITPSAQRRTYLGSHPIIHLYTPQVPQSYSHSQSPSHATLPVCYHHKPDHLQRVCPVDILVRAPLSLLPCDILTPILPVSVVKASLLNASLVSPPLSPLPMLNV